MRHEQWPERLTDTLNRFGEVPFGWGTSDCFDLLAECVEAVTGDKLYPECRGAYADRAGAEALLAARGFADMADLCASLGEEIAVVVAGRGDVGVVLGEDGYSAAVCAGRLWACRSPGPGLAWVRLPLIKRAWRVG